MTQPTDTPGVPTMPKPLTGLALFITNKAMRAHMRSPRRFTEGPASVSLWGRLWWRFVAKRPRLPAP